LQWISFDDYGEKKERKKREERYKKSPSSTLPLQPDQNGRFGRSETADGLSQIIIAKIRVYFAQKSQNKCLVADSFNRIHGVTHSLENNYGARKRRSRGIRRI
jgi:hypothetical protein